jgi:hypothetical protein
LKSLPKINLSPVTRTGRIMCLILACPRGALWRRPMRGAGGGACGAFPVQGSAGGEDKTHAVKPRRPDRDDGPERLGRPSSNPPPGTTTGCQELALRAGPQAGG